MHVRTLQFLLIIGCIGLAPAAVRAAEMAVLDDGWRFHLGAAPDAAASSGYNDAAWREVRVPHDWAIEGPFEPQGDGNTGRLPWKNEGWYRRTFTLPADGDGRRVYFDFDGVMAFPKVYINGQLAGEWDYGYNSFRIDATPHVKWGEDNLLAVHVDTRRWGSRWYPGAGIYRKVTLTTTADVHVGHWGVQVLTASSGEDATRPDTATIRTTVDNHRDAPQRVAVRQRLLSPDGQEAAAGEGTLDLPARDSGTATLSLVVVTRCCGTWAPHLYR
jgi:beta-galactosidase